MPIPPPDVCPVNQRRSGARRGSTGGVPDVCPVNQRRSGARRGSTRGDSGRVRAAAAQLALVLGLLAGPTVATAGAAQPQASAAPAGTWDGRSRLTVEMPGDEETP